MKKWSLLSCFWLFVYIIAAQGNGLEKYLAEKQWDAIASLFADNSYLQLKAAFNECRAVRFEHGTETTLGYSVKYADHGEVGYITYEKEGGKYARLQFVRSLKKLCLIDRFQQYRVDRLTIKIGEAVIELQHGVLYQCKPVDHLFLFAGEMSVVIKPGDLEEQRTLQYLYSSSMFEKKNNQGIFCVSALEFLKDTIDVGPITLEASGDEIKGSLQILHKELGIAVDAFAEYWYMPFANGYEMAIFGKIPKSYYWYVFDRDRSPDTTLVSYPDHIMILNYNSVDEFKMSFQTDDPVKEIHLSLYLNPATRFVSATSKLFFQEIGDVKALLLANSLTIKDFKADAFEKTHLFRRNGAYYLFGKEIKTCNMYYSGILPTSEEVDDLVNIRFDGDASMNADRFTILLRDQNYYPNTGLDFVKSHATFSMPSAQFCLASGILTKVEAHGDRVSYTFESQSTKGISAICGDFFKHKTIAGDIPIHVYAGKTVRVEDYFSDSEIAKIFAFLNTAYGKPEVAEINLLLRRWRNYGGLSHLGFIVLNVADFNVFNSEGKRRVYLRNGPLIFSDLNQNNLIHELAHQWWGGTLSWRSYRDMWITEGLAQYSVFSYLQSTLSGKEFAGLLDKARAWIAKKWRIGPISYGKRISNISADLDGYQSIIYNKAAMVLMMFQDMIGIEDFTARLQRILAKFKYRNVSTQSFIKELSGADPEHTKFFKDWVFNRMLPEVEVTKTIAGVTVTLDFHQKETDFIFPLTVEIKTATGVVREKVIVNKQDQRVTLTAPAAIESVKVEALSAPVKLN